MSGAVAGSADLANSGVDGWRDAGETINVTVELLRRGYTEAQIRQMWGGNLLRVWRANERIAGDLQKKIIP